MAKTYSIHSAFFRSSEKTGTNNIQFFKTVSGLSGMHPVKAFNDRFCTSFIEAVFGNEINSSRSLPNLFTFLG